MTADSYSFNITEYMFSMIIKENRIKANRINRQKKAEKQKNSDILTLLYRVLYKCMISLGCYA